jgi:hypothetical protein
MLACLGRTIFISLGTHMHDFYTLIFLFRYVAQPLDVLAIPTML